ncbi:hypothetical protein [Bradyrhizobium sp. NBAIM08]|uniref:hypothetical protein n=1 Tax=Bradyrhizobium sp. NBAIM08 TaxID=2793815 RepID=UPI001CD69689|nr:hypothetical protein [Bradyrhizobium sp. NBAIM08]MCA1474148.1 hypothetical protein [Bradyrhizobium sp. NBAIM08]
MIEVVVSENGHVASRRLENFAFARRRRAASSLSQVSRGTQLRPPVEIEDDDLYRLQRDRNECEADYRARCEMLGCDQKGFVRLARRT